mmetsp:Transcript_10484/g.16396  ORF Transcript_10484/g.16396 Transcript_10484/m.16396 type:complete len:498 (-) Transcript_10484:164-1657(-)
MRAMAVGKQLASRNAIACLRRLRVGSLSSAQPKSFSSAPQPSPAPQLLSFGPVSVSAPRLFTSSARPVTQPSAFQLPSSSPPQFSRLAAPSAVISHGSVRVQGAPWPRSGLRCFSKTSENVHTLQELPGHKFWTEVFDTLDMDEVEKLRGGEGREVALLTKWLKKPREAVKAGDEIMEIEAGGVVLVLRSDTEGFMGSHQVQEGELMERDAVAAHILDQPEPPIAVSKEAYEEEMLKAEGSVAQMNLGIEEIGKRQGVMRDEIAVACNLTSMQGLSDGSRSVIVGRVPGRPDHVYVPAFGVHNREVSKDLLLEVNFNTAEVIKEEEADSEGAGDQREVEHWIGAADLKIVGEVLKSNPSVECVMVSRSVPAAAIGLRKENTVDLCARFNGAVANLESYSSRDTPEECAKVAELVKSGKRVVFLEGYGALVAGTAVHSVYMDLVELVRVCEVELAAGSGGNMKTPPVNKEKDPLQDLRDKTHFQSLRRLLRSGRDVSD